jgi:ribosomal protein S18 acetylase RimI-like enzyme
VYALGDLVPPYVAHCSWIESPSETALALLNRAFDPPVLFTIGDPAAVAGVLSEIAAEPAFYLHVRPSIVPLIAQRWRIDHLKEMRRMVLDPSRFHPADMGYATRLGPSDLGLLERLYSDGRGTGESPDFFYPSMLDDGVFYGVAEDGELISAAGTHLVAGDVSVGAIGNVYTRSDRRHRGLGAQVTAAVAAELLRCQIRTIALNVAEQNGRARRLYERLGFVDHCGYCEGVARAG